MLQDELEAVPFPLEESEFVLPESDYGELMASKVDSDVKKSAKKEEEKKKEKLQEKEKDPPQTVEKKTVKRTRASTGQTGNTGTPTTPTSAVTPKRRRL